jgi:hypothetical protein
MLGAGPSTPIIREGGLLRHSSLALPHIQLKKSVALPSIKIQENEDIKYVLAL